MTPMCGGKTVETPYEPGRTVRPDVARCRANPRAGADAGRDRPVVLEIDDGLRRGGSLLHRIFSRPSNLESGKMDSEIDYCEPNGPTGHRADDRQRHPLAGPRGARA